MILSTKELVGWRVLIDLNKVSTFGRLGPQVRGGWRSARGVVLVSLSDGVRGWPPALQHRKIAKIWSVPAHGGRSPEQDNLFW